VPIAQLLVQIQRQIRPHIELRFLRAHGTEAQATEIPAVRRRYDRDLELRPGGHAGRR
jgi:hypothetical protein